ncbi:hypothetical protein QFZ37_001478 [Chryseobacterium ginsenosidimutans]|uniref:hypothetical protein n=1 Tax=Chryseobacterium ginsenosidimutans TaxID=687846 RepID=UPI0027884CB4|nr:hypothetical protein [Chryseobacterium ginsenosidimutans]MDQ0593109.1 hypothetical protein [Chryseobacterium ginsenosidimutans]
MKLKLVLILLIQACIFNAQISNKLKEKVENIDKKFFTIILQQYDTEAYAELYNLYSEISKVATNDELFYLALNGNTFIRHNAASSLVYRKDKRIVDLYKYYSKFPMEYEVKMSCIIAKQDMAFSIRGHILADLRGYEDYKLASERLNQPITDFYSKEEIDYYEKLDTNFLNDCIDEFENIDVIFIPDRLDIYKEINEHWKDGKLQGPYN